ncbi:MAG: hypothetical protein HY671_05010 [Chloroflexi bacterium]|nr:hypothetical protein [Chloroflexota bacterium]
MAGDKPRGRAGSEVRTGRFIKQWLEKNGEGACSEMHQSFKQHIYRLNALRPRAKLLRTPTYESFSKYFGHIRRLGLVEFVREDPMVEPGHEALLTIRDKREVVPVMRRIYRLTEEGRLPELAVVWDDPLLRSLFRAALNKPPSP